MSGEHWEGKLVKGKTNEGRVETIVFLLQSGCYHLYIKLPVGLTIFYLQSKKDWV